MSTPRPQAEGIKQLENDRVIVTEWRFAPGLLPAGDGADEGK